MEKLGLVLYAVSSAMHDHWGCDLPGHLTLRVARAKSLHTFYAGMEFPPELPRWLMAPTMNIVRSGSLGTVLWPLLWEERDGHQRI